MTVQPANTMREFETSNYIIRATAEEELDLDLSWDEDGSARAGIESGKYMVFCAHVEVIHKATGTVLGEDYLGDCIYESFAAFMDHRVCGKQNREWAKQGKEGRCGSYFSDMIHSAIQEARKNYPKYKLGQLRGAKGD